jgi:phosphoglycolate phosphatase-like HAD superfamily hydrolase
MKKCFSETKFIMFDLDNTLFDERDYLFQGYYRIAQYLSQKYLINLDSIYGFLTLKFEPSQRSNLFDELLLYINVPNFEIKNLLKILRTFDPLNKIYLFPFMRDLLIQIKCNNIPYVIITNGNTTQQKNKVKYIEWDGLKPSIFFANDFAPKPSPIVYHEAIFPIYQDLILSGEVLYIGDSYVDKLFAENIDVRYIDVNELELINKK